MGIENIPRTIWWEDDAVHLVDQSRLPLIGDILVCNTHEGICTAVKSMAVRGAPALGVAAALGVALWVRNESGDLETADAFLDALDGVSDVIAATRPTAVNLSWGAERMRRLARANADLPLAELRDLIVQEANNLVAEDEDRNRAIGRYGADLLAEGSKLLTHCNAGSLATAYFGTALGIIFTAAEDGKVEHVWVDETRPVMQGARLTSWELLLAGVPCALITDSMAGHVMAEHLVDAVIVGADRIAANGDVANKIGTYGLAVLAKHHGIPFYVAAPTSSVDLTLADGSTIPIEQRDPREVAGMTVAGTLTPDSPEASRALDTLTADAPYFFDMAKGHEFAISRKGGAFAFDGWFRISPPGVPVYNPAFDITPADLVTAIVTERGVARPSEHDGVTDFALSLAEFTAGSGAIHEL